MVKRTAENTGRGVTGETAGGEEPLTLNDLLEIVKQQIADTRSELAKFDADNEVPEYNQKTLVGDNPMVYRLRQPLAVKLKKLEDLEYAIIQKLNEA